MTTDFNDTLASALWLGARGWKVHDLDHPTLAVCAGLKSSHHDPARCSGDKRGKHPCTKWSATATDDEGGIAAMFAGTTRNIGIDTGKSGLLVIDEDVPGSLIAVACRLGEHVPETFAVGTGRGTHYYFEQPRTPLGNKEGLLRGSGCNVRGRGGYVVAPGSTHFNGKRYVPIDPEAPALALPDWLRRALTMAPSVSNAGETRANLDDSHKGPIPYGHRHSALVSYAGRLLATGLSLEEATPLHHGRWEDCEQPDGHKAPWEDALAILCDVYDRYSGGVVRPTPGATTRRRVVLTTSIGIKPRRVEWLYEGRLALGTFGLLAGREGQGKSTVAAWLVAQVTRGELPGCHFGTPKPVLICATEDSWSHTIVPRLIAAGADLALVYRVDVVEAMDTAGILDLPKDIPAVQAEAMKVGAALLVLDPLTSRLSKNLDTHKDADTRQALEPLVAMAEAAGLAVIGIMHFNKGATTDPLTAVMGSRAFAAVARSVHTVVRDPDDDDRRYFATPKNNLGRSDLPMLSFTIIGHPVETDDGTAWTSRIAWGGEVTGTVSDLMARAANPGDRSAVVEASDWLADFLQSQGGRVASAVIRDAGESAGHSYDSLKRARRLLGIIAESAGFPRRTYWSVLQSEHQSEQC